MYGDTIMKTWKMNMWSMLSDLEWESHHLDHLQHLSILVVPSENGDIKTLAILKFETQMKEYIGKILNTVSTLVLQKIQI